MKRKRKMIPYFFFFNCRTFFANENATRENNRYSKEDRHSRKNYKRFFCDSQLGEKILFFFQRHALWKKVKLPYHSVPNFSAKLSTNLIALNLDTNQRNSLLNNEYSYNGTRAYAQSKLATILHVKEVARQLKVRE